MMIADVLLIGFGISIALGGFLAVHAKNIFHNALYFGLALLGVAGIYILLGSEFLGLVQILVYVGAVLVAIIFAIMITPALFLKPTPRKTVKQLVSLLTGFSISGFLLFLLVHAKPTTWNQKISFTTDIFHIKQVGAVLLSKQALPFEVITVVLLIAIIGSLLNVREED
jgi:NADH-quinone oxidoreductase subunit J